MTSARQHDWLRESSRRTKCVYCGLVAHSKRSLLDGRPYTLWTLEEAFWDSRAELRTPTCPPLGK